MTRRLRALWRGLARSPGHSAIVVLTLALGIGAPTAFFSVVNGVLLRPLPFLEPDRLVMLWQRAPGVGVDEDWFSPTQYFDIREQVTGFENAAIVFGRNVTLTGDDAEPERVGALDVSSSFFELLGIEPALGDAWSSSDDAPGAPRKVLLSQKVFASRFRGDPSVVGRSTRVDGERVEIAGVLPHVPLDADIFPTLVTVPVFDLVMSLPLEDPQRTTHGSENYNILARTAPGVSRAELETELVAVAETFVADPESLGAGLAAGTDYRIGVVSLLDQAVGHVRLPLLVLLAATSLLLIIGCANVANLLLTRAAKRRRELALRAALGAGRARAVVDSLSEGLLYGGMGCVAGVGLAAIGLRVLRTIAPAELPRLGEIGMDVEVLGFAASISMLASLAFGLAPALTISEVTPKHALVDSGSASLGGSRWRGGARALVLLQIALSVVLTIGAGLLVRTFIELGETDPGFRPGGRLSFRLSLVGERYQTPRARAQFFELLFDRLRSLPGVIDAGGVSMLPLTRGYAWTDFAVEGFESPDERERIVSDLHVATPGYFEAMGVPLLSGRTFRRDDDSEPGVVIVNRAFAERFWTIEEAVGKWVGRAPEERSRIVGVVESVKHYGLAADARLTVFYPYQVSGRRTLFGVLDAGASPLSMAPKLAAEVKALDPQIPVYDIRTMSDRLARSLARQRLLMVLLVSFSAIALTLATVGLYGVLSFTVQTHTRELALRMALGARREDVYRLVLHGIAVVTGWGIFAGVVTTLIASRFISTLVYGVSATDTWTFVGAAALVLVVAVVASGIPARRAAAIEPAVALKQD